MILAFESSCDDTSVALMDAQGIVLALRSQNQDAVHAPYGGVFPELACRNHTRWILPLLDQVFSDSGAQWKDVKAIAVTARPGLIGSLMVGVTTAKALALAKGLPLIDVNHLEGHLHACFVDRTSKGGALNYPFLGLCVSGGHTALYLVKGLGKYEKLGQTLDDAAGEAFDKFGKLIGLGYPAGPVVDKRAAGGDAKAYAFPRPLVKRNKDLNFSFSGLKTAGLEQVRRLAPAGSESDSSFDEKTIANLCASYQEAIVDVLIEKLVRAVKKTGIKTVVITGGVAANSRLRSRAEDWAKTIGVAVHTPPRSLCADNAAMIAYVGLQKYKAKQFTDLSLSPQALSNPKEP